SRMSAIAPLGTPSRNTGAVETDCTSATITSDTDSEVISHAAATSFIHMQALAVTHPPHSMRNTGCASGVHADTGAMALAPPAEEASLMPVNLSPDAALRSPKDALRPTMQMPAPPAAPRCAAGSAPPRTTAGPPAAPRGAAGHGPRRTACTS